VNAEDLGEEARRVEAARAMQTTPHAYVKTEGHPWCAECSLHREALCHRDGPRVVDAPCESRLS
jgi:hypothetical protein